jgi:hypothetical protein
MYPKCLKAQVSVMALMLSAPLAFADVNYNQRAKEQAERAAAAASIAAEQVESARMAEPGTASSDSSRSPTTTSDTTQTAQNGAESSVSSQSKTKANRDSLQTQTESPEDLDGPLEDQPLVIDVSNLYDEDGLGQLSMQWQVQLPSGGWQSIDGATSQSFTPLQRHVSRSLRVVIQYVDGQGTLEIIETAPTGPVQNVNDLPQGLPRITGTAEEDNTLKIDVSEITDEDGLGTFSYQWERSLDGARWMPYESNSVNPSLLRLDQAEVGYVYRAIVSYVDGFGTQEMLVTPATNMVKNVDDPTVGEVLIVGQPRKGERLEIDTSNVSDDDGIANIRTTWEMSSNGRAWAAIPDVYGSSMTLTQSHVGKLIRVRSVVVDNFGSETTLFSQPTSIVQNVNSKPKGVIRILATGS